MSSLTRRQDNLIVIADGIANAYAHADQGIYFPQMHNCKNVYFIMLTLACKGVN